MFKLIFSLIILSSSSWAQDLPTITVTKATWAGKDVTQEAKGHCDGNFSCDYKVSEDYIGAAQSTKKSFTIQWTCTGLLAKQTHSVPHDATDVTFTIDCQKAVKAPPPAPSKGHSTKIFPAKGAAKWSAQNYPLSLRNMILSKAANSLKVSVGQACFSALRKVYASGKKLSSSLIKSRMLPISSFSFLGDGNVFYHYTSSEDMLPIARHNRPLDVFNFLRSRDKDSFSSWLSAMYVADDPESSKSYGEYQVRVYLRKQTMILAESDYAEAGGENSLGDVVSQELVKRYPGLKACYEYTNDEGEVVHDDTSLYFLAAEEMGVDMIHYDFSIGDGHWFQILNPYAIDHLETDN